MITGTEVVQVVRDVWSALGAPPLGPELDPDGPVGAEVLTGEVALSGAFDGVVRIELPRPDAALAAQAVFDLAEPDDAQVADTVAELANTVGGNLKGLLPAPSRLSLPTVGAPAPAGRTVCSVRLQSRSGAVRVSVLAG